MSSLTIGGSAYRCLPWPTPIIKPAITWVQGSSGYWSGFDRGASQDVYEAEVTFTDTDSPIDGLAATFEANRSAITLSSFNSEIFSPNVDHTGSITCTVVDFGRKEHVQWAGTANNVQTLTARLRAISPTLLGTTPSLATLKLQEHYSADHTWTLNKHFSYNQSASYIDHQTDSGTFRGVFQQTLAQTRAILRYLLVTARASTVTLPTFPGVTYPFGHSRGTGPFPCNIRSFSVTRKDLNRWLISIEFVQAV